MSKKQKKTLVRILVCGAIFFSALFIPFSEFVKNIMYIIAFVVIGYDIIIRAVKNIFHGQVFDENFLMSVATIGAFGVGDFAEGVAVMLFYQVGEFFQSYAVGRSRKSISSLMDIRPDYANLLKDGVEAKVDPYDVLKGDVILIKPGEKVPLDGIVLEGKSSLNTTALTGESAPRSVCQGESVISGCINMSGVLKVQVSGSFEESTVSKILDLVENSSSNKAKAENFITKFARYYTPIVVISAVVLAVVPPLFLGATPEIWGDWVYRALTFLVVSCPCALVISVPLSFFAGIGAASKCGVLIKGGNYLEALSKAETVVFDKTGTLTQGSFFVTAVHPQKIDSDKLIEIGAYGECFSTHPIATSIKKHYGKEIDKSRVKDVEELSGFGIKVNFDNNEVYLGNKKLMDKIKVKCQECHKVGTIIHIAVNGEYEGHIVISDQVKPDSFNAIQSLKAMGVSKTVMLTGDKKQVGEEIGNQLGLDEIYSELLPADKVLKVEEIIKNKSPKGTVVFVGDGINDAPVLGRADIGIAMGALGSDAAIEAADVVLMDDKPSKIPMAIKISKHTKKIVMQNIVFALGVKVIVLVLSAFGIANMWEAVFADVGVSIIAILNSMRALYISRKLKKND